MSGAEKINAKVSNIIKLNDLVTRFEFERTDGQLFPTFSGGDIAKKAGALARDQAQVAKDLPVPCATRHYVRHFRGCNQK